MSLSTLEILRNRYQSEYIKRSQYRSHIGMSISKDYREKKRGNYPKITKIGATEYISLADLATYLNAQTADSAPTPKRGRPAGSKNKPKLPTLPLLASGGFTPPIELF